jgi:hypothetical protein
MSQTISQRLDYLRPTCRDSWRAGRIERVQVTVRRGEVGALGKPRPGLLPDMEEARSGEQCIEHKQTS